VVSLPRKCSLISTVAEIKLHRSCLVSSITFLFICNRFSNQCPHSHPVTSLPFRYRDAKRIRKKYNSILFERMNGNGKHTETEHVFFYISYGILMDKCNSYGDTATDERKRNAGNQTLQRRACLPPPVRRSHYQQQNGLRLYEQTQCHHPGQSQRSVVPHRLYEQTQCHHPAQSQRSVVPHRLELSPTHSQCTVSFLATTCYSVQQNDVLLCTAKRRVTLYSKTTCYSVQQNDVLLCTAKRRVTLHSKTTCYSAQQNDVLLCTATAHAVRSVK